MKTKAIIRIIISSLLIVTLVSVMIGGILLGSVSFHFFEGGLTDGIIASEGSYLASEIQDLDIRWVSGSVTIQTSPDTSLITFQETGATSESDTMIYRYSTGELTIQYRKAEVFLGFSFDSHGKDLVITVPTDWKGRIIQLSNVSADFNANELSAECFQLENVSGHCILDNCSIDQLELETVSGQIDAMGLFDTISLESVSADCILKVKHGIRAIGSDSVSGELTVYLPSYEGFTAQLDSVSGRISTDLVTTIQNDKYIHKDGFCRIDADSVSGDLNILKMPSLTE
ncbi:MAG: DUF4097 family beta strand repeat protein [Oscillospiraceae bacterium]|nr:DUF4097 family beta strand repeat protein [Oscillospiraceae bacterium]